MNLLVKQSESLCLVNIRLSGLIVEKFPPSAQLFGYFCIVLVRVVLHYFPSLQLGPDHEGIHRPLDMIDWVFFRL